ncbi:magnesium chelatase subunit D [Mycobacterium frederiksbergense]|uniref:Magnesium chelatase subunit D n=1 Tax=Mycolicibacterium frederiksbergense TaxID=117567 RepID=A0ABT6KRL5_9MYCO|nr:magnesium chelatase subunit D family protein [Mycolicibacterium frederiksbergense]MDH6193388.1 magnesium chelatase subunit D [Mycolicibacterium frederiksbergense]
MVAVNHTYPFSALVGQDRLRLALLLCAVHPEIGGVLIRGEKGTAKSTAVRGLAAVLSGVDDDARLVELPIGATEDRVVGSLDLQKVLRDGEHAFSPGLLARAHGGVLYVDEVNLLHDHLVDVLLDAAAMGRVHVERDGISHTHDARFVLIGTMNPEEGELRPQLLDRFGLTVDVAASRDVDIRVEVIRARMDFEADPQAFVDRHAVADAELSDRIAAARAAIGSVLLPDSELRRIAALCAAFDVDGMRADLVVARTAVAHAAWRGATTVAEEDIRVAAELALPHRRRRDPFDDPGLDPERLEEAMQQAGESASQSAPESGSDPEPDPDPDFDPPGGGGGSDAESQAPQGNSSQSAVKQSSTRQSGSPSAVFRTKALVVPGVGEGAPGRRSRARNRTGTPIAATAEPGTGHGLHMFATLLATAGRQQGAGLPRPRPEDVRRAVREGREGNLVIFVVDASGSMAARDRMSAVSGATLSLLRDAYQRRDKVAVITFRQQDAQLLLPPTSSVHIASRRLARFDTGGKTPLAQGLLAARDLVIREKARDRARRSLVVVLTDGRATGGPDPLGRTRTAAAALLAEGAAAVVVDCETSFVRLELAGQLAQQLGAPAVRLEQLRATELTRLVQDQTAA